METASKRVTFQVLDVSCIQCMVDVRKVLEKQSGIRDIKVNQMLNIFYVDYDSTKTSEDEIEKFLKKIGYKIAKIRSMKDMQTSQDMKTN